MTTQQENKLDYISTKLDAHIKTFNSSAVWYRRVYFWTSIATLILSATITILAGWKPPLDDFAGDAILALSALITVISGWGLFFSPKKCHMCVKPQSISGTQEQDRFYAGTAEHGGK